MLVRGMFSAFGMSARLDFASSPRIRSAYGGDEGMSTAEYAIGTVAAAAFATLLYTVVTGDSVTGALTSLVQRALETSF